MDADGIGVHHEGATAGAQCHQFETLLQPAEQQSDENADDGTDG